jgi:hypothetical protein
MSNDLGRTTPLLGVRYCVTQDPARNAETALGFFMGNPGATLYADGLGWYVVHQGWTQISPEVILAETH